jgi:NAD-dependent SIR2 family protein deacetylase
MTQLNELDSLLRKVGGVIAAAEALLIGAGAGMGVDSGLPDFRGAEGFWKAYPPFRGKDFSEISTPHWFETDPELAWGFFGHRLNLYRAAVPHDGFEILRRWGERMPSGCFVFTSNVDGQFQKAGFAEEQIVERHGSIHYLQCSRPCRSELWSTADLQIDVDEATIRAAAPLPTCPTCEAVARPNILMFGDGDWVYDRYAAQAARYRRWLNILGRGRLAIVELGAGLSVPTVRHECQRLGGRLIRINPRDNETPGGGISLPLGALEALTALDSLVQNPA